MLTHVPDCWVLCEDERAWFGFGCVTAPQEKKKTDLTSINQITLKNLNQKNSTSTAQKPSAVFRPRAERSLRKIDLCD